VENLGGSDAEPAYKKVNNPKRKRSVKKSLLLLLFGSLFAGSAFSQRLINTDSATTPTLYVQGSGDFSTALTAALIKKNVPVVVVTDQSKAEYTLQSAAVYSKDESGAGKIARCMFADCIGINGYSSVSVQLVRTQDSAVLWAYQVRKGNSGPLGIQSLSEAIARHLKHDYLIKHPEQNAPAS
jgi:hypothetical protein